MKAKKAPAPRDRKSFRLQKKTIVYISKLAAHMEKAESEVIEELVDRAIYIALKTNYKRMF